MTESVTKLALLVAADPAKRRIDAQEPPVERDEAHPDRRILEGSAEALLALAQRLVRAGKLARMRPFVA
jgi:hypothetical protein